MRIHPHIRIREHIQDLIRKVRRLAATLFVLSLLAAAFALLALVAAPSAHATAYYWDSNGTTAGFGTTTGTWGTSTFWSTVAAGTGATANTTITTADTRKMARL